MSPTHRILLILISLLLSGLSACGMNKTSQPGANTATVSEQGINVVLGQATHLVETDSEIEALAFGDTWLLWLEDSNNALQFMAIKQAELGDARALNSLDHDIDLICATELDQPDLLEVFIHDGDSYFYHYWFNTQNSVLTLVRKIATNPDIDACFVSADSLIFNDPYIGGLSLERNPETDSVLRVASASDTKQLSELSATQPYYQAASSKYARELHAVTPSLETAPVATGGDAADDPVVLSTNDTHWIVGTNKKRGLAVYDFSGKQVAFLPRGRLNNVDAIELEHGRFLLAASNRTERSIDLFIADPDKGVIDFHKAIALDMGDPYGLCMGKTEQGLAVFVGDSDSVHEHWAIAADLNSGQRVKQYQFDTQTEGCVFDAATQTLYIGQEDKGIWKFVLAKGTRELLESIEAGHLVADVEGMDIYQNAQSRYLIASSQGDNSYVVYNLEPWAFVAKFNIVADVTAGIDGASETDGLAVSATAIPGYPQGVLVVQDGRNRAPQQNQNFKVIDWRELPLKEGADLAR